MSDREKVSALLWQFQEVIALDDSELLSHRINTGDAQQVLQQAQRLSFHQQEEVCGLLDNMLSRGELWTMGITHGLGKN